MEGFLSKFNFEGFYKNPENLDLNGKGISDQDLILLVEIIIQKDLQVKFLNLNHNRLTSLPESFGKLSSLINLKLDFNQLDLLPESFGKLTRLINLDLNHNRLTSLPESFGELKSLINLKLDFNQLDLLPESFGKLTRLITLDLNHNRLTSLPESFGQLSSLITLDLDFNRLTSLSESFGQLTALINFNLSFNQITSLPYILRNLRNLRKFISLGNPLDLDPIMLRWINRFKKFKGATFYDDSQNIHNSEIIQSVRETIERLLNLKIYDKNVVNKILTDSDFTEEEKWVFLQNSQDSCVHLAFGLTFLDALSLVYPLFCSADMPKEAKKVLAEEVKDAQDKCLTGKIVRLFNSLNGLHPAVQIRFSEHTEIGNIFNYLREKHAHLSPDDLKALITRKLIKRGYSQGQISVWTDHL